MTLDDFLALYSKRLNSYVFRFRRQFHLPPHLQEDLHQAALLGVWKQLESWREYEGGKSAFNWCATGIRRNMDEVMRRHHGQKPRSNMPILLETVELTETHAVDHSACDIEKVIDLQRLLAADKKPAHIVRFIATALSPASGADIARASGISRQAVCLSVSQTRKRLRLAMG